MSLVQYAKKRNFKKTSEPKAGKPSGKGLAFVVQRHKASHLHYDFRLEIDGVLKSWAVPKGPSMNPADKRLAMMVEDHPYDYKNFAGIIPEGNYGAGIVEIWDSGYYSDIKGSDKKTSEKTLRTELEKGSIKFILHGKKLKGEFALVRMKGRGENAWLLIKHRDEYATDEAYNSEDETPVNSPINKALQKQPLPIKKTHLKADKASNQKKVHSFFKPMLAKETDKPFDDKDWVFEMKWDGYRAIAEIHKHDVTLYSRNGNNFNTTFPLVAQELAKLKASAVLDGEIVALDKEGKPSFQLLQDYRNNPAVALRYYVFDILSLQGKDITGLTLMQRKELLEDLLNKQLRKNEVVRYSEYIDTRGSAFFTETKKKNLEGIMAKRKDSTYIAGSRSSDWLKIKHHKTMDAIIIGFTRPRGSRKHFGSLILASNKGNTLKYIGHTGSGFDTSLLQEISEQLEPLIQKKSPLRETIKTNMPATWVRPELVCEVKYSEITQDGILRHPIFLHMRTDKSANETTEETIVPPVTQRNTVQDKTYTFGKISVPTSHNSKIFWPEEGITKGEVIDYYQGVADYILPYLIDRPQSLKRNPNGIKDSGFFQKDMGSAVPDWIKTFRIFSESANKNIDFMLCNNKAALAFMNNLGCIEINPMHSTTKNIDKPDYLVIDIDPSEDNTYNQVVETAQVIHSILEKAGAASFCKTSGATGMHIYVPTEKKYTYDQAKNFAHLICSMAQEQLPHFTTLERNLSKRGKPNIYLDYLQNRRGQTIASVYSLRPYPGATVSTPLKWNEVRAGLDPKEFNIHTIEKRLKKAGDIFSGVLGKGINIATCLKKLDAQLK